MIFASISNRVMTRCTSRNISLLLSNLQCSCSIAARPLAASVLSPQTTFRRPRKALIHWPRSTGTIFPGVRRYSTTWDVLTSFTGKLRHHPTLLTGPILEVLDKLDSRIHFQGFVGINKSSGLRHLSVLRGFPVHLSRVVKDTISYIFHESKN